MTARLVVAVLSVCLVALAQDLRNLGMGRLSALLESDIHRIALYDFGENPAGLLSAAAPVRRPATDVEAGGAGLPWESQAAQSGYSISEAFISGWGVHPRGDTVLFPAWSVGQPLPADFQEFIPLGALGYSNKQFFPSRPAGAYLRKSDGSFALALRGCWSHFEGEDMPTVNVPEFGFEGANRLSSVDIGYRAVALYGMGGQEWGSGQYIGTDAGVGVAVPGEALSGGASLDYYHPMYHVKGFGYDTTYHTNAARGRGALVLQPAETLKVGLKAGYTWSDVMQVKTLTPSAGMRALYEPAGVPLAAGLEAAWMKATASSGGEPDGGQDSLYLGGGLGLRLPVLFVGAELQRTAWGFSYTDARYQVTQLSLNAGAEATLGPAHIRGGFAHSVMKGSESRADTTLLYTGGLGLDLQGLWLDVAYNMEVPRHGAYEHQLQLSAKFSGSDE